MNEEVKASSVKLTYQSKKVPDYQILNSKDTYKVLKKIYDKETIEYKEYFYVLLLNVKNNLIGYYKVSEGGLTETTVDIRIIFQAALLSNAVKIIISHNHPSGKLNPSKYDNEITEKIKSSGKILNIHLIDHVIVNKKDYYSYLDEGIL